MKGIKVFLLAVAFLVGCGSDKHEDIYVGGTQVQLYLVNQSNYPNEKIQKLLYALNLQLQVDFKPVWAIDAKIFYQDPPDSRYQTVILKQNFADFPAAWHKSLGFHTTGTLAYVDIDECKYDEYISLAVSHEILEMLVNPNVERTGYEVCDPVHLLAYSYLQGDLAVTDFVYPAFYNPLAPGPYDRNGIVQAPLQPAPGSTLFATLQSLLKLSAWDINVKQKSRK